MSGRGLFVACIASVVGVVAAPANAVAPTGGQVEDLRRVAATFADCVVRTNAALARGIILQDMTNEQIAKDPAARRVVNGACMNDNSSDNAIGPAVPTGLKLGGDLFRYNLADALIRKDYASQDHFDFTATPALSHREPAPLPPNLANGSSKASQEAQQRYHTFQVGAQFSRFGECVCRRSTDSVRKLLASGVLTDGEKDAFSEVAPILGQCISDGQMRLSREVVRGVLALNFYRLAGAPAGAEVIVLKGAI